MSILVPVLMCSIVVSGIGVLNIGDRTPSILAADILVVGMVYIAILRRLVSSVKFLRDPLVLILGTLWLFADLASWLVNGSDNFKALLSIKILLTSLGAYFVCLSFFSKPRSANWGIVGIIAAPTLISILLIQQYAGTDWAGASPDKNLITLGFGGSNYLSTFMVIGIPTAIGAGMTHRTAGHRRAIYA